MHSSKTSQRGESDATDISVHALSPAFSYTDPIDEKRTRTFELDVNTFS